MSRFYITILPILKKTAREGDLQAGTGTRDSGLKEKIAEALQVQLFPL